MRRTLAEHRAELLACLRCGDSGDGLRPVVPTATISPDDLLADRRVEWEERAAIREYEVEQARAHAEAEALRKAVDRRRAAGRDDAGRRRDVP